MIRQYLRNEHAYGEVNHFLKVLVRCPEHIDQVDQQMKSFNGVIHRVVEEGRSIALLEDGDLYLSDAIVQQEALDGAGVRGQHDVYREHLGTEYQPVRSGVCPQAKCRCTTINQPLVLQQSATKIVRYGLAVALHKNVNDLDDTLEHGDF